MKKLLFLSIISLFILGCDNQSGEAEFTGNEVSFDMIPGSVNGNETNGTLTIREKSNGLAQIEISLEGVLNNANHPVHLHYGSLADDGNVATLLNPIEEVNGVGKSTTTLNEFENGTAITYADLISFNGSIKIHFEASGPLENEILGSTNIGSNSTENAAYLSGEKSITICNSDY